LDPPPPPRVTLFSQLFFFEIEQDIYIIKQTPT
jgi:hypothetical protein